MAQLLPTLKDVAHEVEYLTAQTSYYQEIRSIVAIINDDTLTNEQKKELISDHAPAAERYGKAAMHHSARYLFKGHKGDAIEYQEHFAREARRLREENERLRQELDDLRVAREGDPETLVSATTEAGQGVETPLRQEHRPWWRRWFGA